MDSRELGAPLKRKLFSSKSLGNIRANLRRGPNDLIVEESIGSSPNLWNPSLAQQHFGKACALSPAASGDLDDLIPAARTVSLPTLAGLTEKQPLNVLYPSLEGLELLRTLGELLCRPLLLLYNLPLVSLQFRPDISLEILHRKKGMAKLLTNHIHPSRFRSSIVQVKAVRFTSLGGSDT